MNEIKHIYAGNSKLGIHSLVRMNKMKMFACETRAVLGNETARKTSLIALDAYRCCRRWRRRRNTHKTASGITTIFIAVNLMWIITIFVIVVLCGAKLAVCEAPITIIIVAAADIDFV